MSKKQAEESAPEEKKEPTEQEKQQKQHDDQLAAMLSPETEFSVGQEVTLSDGTPGKIIAVNGDKETGFIYAVQHSITTSFSAAQLK